MATRPRQAQVRQAEAWPGEAAAVRLGQLPLLPHWRLPDLDILVLYRSRRHLPVKLHPRAAGTSLYTLIGDTQ